MKKIQKNVIILGCFLSLASFSCKKEIIQEIEYPQHLLTGDIFLECKEENTSNQDFISFHMNNQRNCIAFARPNENTGNCGLELRKHSDDINWYQFSSCVYRSIGGERTLLRIYLAKPDLYDNIRNLETGSYNYYHQGDGLSLNENIFKISLIPVSATSVNRFNFGNLLDNIHTFHTEDADQETESYFRITHIESIQEGSKSFSRFFLEFSCNLQDQFGRLIQLRDGEASFTINLN